MKNTNKVLSVRVFGIAVITAIVFAVIPLTACSKSESSGGDLKSAKELKTYLNKQFAKNSFPIIEASVVADESMLPKIVEVINSSKVKNVSLNLTGNALTKIPSEAFKDCNLYSVTIPEGVNSIEERAFSGCTRLTSVTIPASVNSINNGAFYGCTSLTRVTIPEGVSSIKEMAFYGCTSLTSVTIPASVSSIRDLAFEDCVNLTSITFATGSNIIDYNFGNNVVPEGIFTKGKNTLKKDYSTRKAGTYKFDSIDSWTQREYIGFW
jgi:hypothetical protein